MKVAPRLMNQARWFMRSAVELLALLGHIAKERGRREALAMRLCQSVTLLDELAHADGLDVRENTAMLWAEKGPNDVLESDAR